MYKVNATGALEALTPKQLERAARRAVDRTVTQVRREIVTRVVERTSVVRSAVNRRVKVVRRSRPGDLRAVIEADKKPILVERFRPSVGGNRQVSVFADIDTRPGVGVALIRKAFSPIGSRARSRIYERVVRGGRRVSRLPIRKAQGAGLGLMLPPLLNDIQKDAEKWLIERLDIELTKEYGRL